MHVEYERCIVLPLVPRAVCPGSIGLFVVDSWFVGCRAFSGGTPFRRVDLLFLVPAGAISFGTIVTVDDPRRRLLVLAAVMVALLVASLVRLERRDLQAKWGRWDHRVQRARLVQPGPKGFKGKQD